ncbi:hypothetical protein BGW42_008206 [Actinomortierella wolfii]|nr:hypothetical protein BGW42_008206 [Actinomortierella wolfii]
MKNPFQASPKPASADSASSTTITLFRKSTESVEQDGRAKLSSSGREKRHRTSDDSNDQSPKDDPFQYLTNEQREAVIENLDIEMADRLMRLRKQVEVLKQNLVFRGEIEIDRIPTYVRPLTMEEFWLKFNGDANAYRQRQAQIKADVQQSVLQLMGVHVDKTSSTLNSTSVTNGNSRKRQRQEV